MYYTILAPCGASLYPLQHPLSLQPSVTARLHRRLLLLLPFSTSTAGLVCVVCMSWRGVQGQPECLIYSPPSNAGICGIRMFWGGDFACVCGGKCVCVCVSVCRCVCVCVCIPVHVVRPSVACFLADQSAACARAPSSAASSRQPAASSQSPPAGGP